MLGEQELRRVVSWVDFSENNVTRYHEAGNCEVGKTDSRYDLAVIQQPSDNEYYRLLAILEEFMFAKRGVENSQFNVGIT